MSQHPDVLIVHEPGSTWAAGLVTRLTEAGAAVETRTTKTTEQNSPADLMGAAQRARMVVADPGLDGLWVGVLAGVRSTHGHEPLVIPPGQTSTLLGPGVVEAIPAERLFSAICERLNLHPTESMARGVLPRRRTPLAGEAWPQGHGFADHFRRIIENPAGRGYTPAHLVGNQDHLLSMVAAVSDSNELLAASLRAQHPGLGAGRNHVAIGQERYGWEAALAVRGDAPLEGLSRAEIARITEWRETQQATRAARAERLTNFRLGVVEEPDLYLNAKWRIWRDRDLGALFAGDPLMPDPCDETLDWPQLGTVTFWLSALQHRTLPELIEYLRNPAVMSGRAWGQRPPTQGRWAAPKPADILTEMVELHPPRSEAEILCWVTLVQRRLPARIASSVDKGVRSWPGLDRRIVQAMAHGIGGPIYRDWHEAIERAAPAIQR